MLRHIVMIKFKSDIDLKSESEMLKSMLIDLETSINSLQKMEVGLNISTKPSAFDLVLTADFIDVDGLDDYRVHPEHVKVLDYLKKVIEKVHVVDYII